MPVARVVAVGHLVATFDMITVRELDVIEQLRVRHPRIRVAVLDDDTVTDLYGRPPITPLAERALLARHLRGVDEVVVHDPQQRPADDDPQVCYVIDGEPLPSTLGYEVVIPGLTTAATMVHLATAAVGEAVA